MHVHAHAHTDTATKTTAVQFVTESQTALHTIHTTAWNIFCHNIAEHITT